MRIGAIIQARMGSTRLSGKVMMDLCGKPVIHHVIERMKQSKLVDEIIIATTILKQDDIIVKQAKQNGVKWFRGSETDVLSRYYEAALENNLDIVVRITSDCPLIDPNVVDEIIQYYIDNNFIIVSNASANITERTYPRGLDTEVFSMAALEKAFNLADKGYQREHVTPYIYENSDRTFYYKNEVDYSDQRWTLDTIEDYELIQFVYNNFYKGKHDFFMKDVVKVLEENPDIIKINSHIEQKKLTE